MKQNMTINELMENLRNEILKEMQRSNYSQTKFASICDISYENLCKIIYGKSKDIKVSTLLKICSNSDINFENLFPEMKHNFEISININGTDYIIVEKNKYVKYR